MCASCLLVFVWLLRYIFYLFYKIFLIFLLTKWSVRFSKARTSILSSRLRHLLCVTWDAAMVFPKPFYQWLKLGLLTETWWWFSLVWICRLVRVPKIYPNSAKLILTLINVESTYFLLCRSKLDKNSFCVFQYLLNKLLKKRTYHNHYLNDFRFAKIN